MGGKKKKAKNQRQLFILSDSTGDTASRIVRAALMQFVGERLTIRRFPNVLRQSEVRRILAEAKKEPTLVAHTFAAGPLRRVIAEAASDVGIETLDLLGPLMSKLEEFLQAEPQEQPGLLHKIDEDYFRRVDAVEFAVMHDDGKHLEGLQHADFVLTGLSRTGKTPLSVYLALMGWRVGNVPLVQGQSIPKEVLALPKERVVGLLIDPRRLAEIRRARLSYIAPGQRMSYDEEEAVRDEIAWCRRLFGRHRIRSVDVTQKAIEESAHEVLTLIKMADEMGARREAEDGKGKKKGGSRTRKRA